MSYNATLVKDLDTSTPTEGSTLPSELNDAIREIKTCIKPLLGLLTKTADYSMSETDEIVIGTPTSVDITITLPAVAACATSAFAKRVTIINWSTQLYNVIVDGYGAETVDGAATVTIRPSMALTLVCNGTTWYSLRDVPRFRGCRVTNSADQTLTAYGTTTFTFDTEAYDTDGIHSTSANTDRLTVPSGVSFVRVAAQVQIKNQQGTNYSGQIQILKNGAVIAKFKTENDGISDPVSHIQTGVIAVSAGDYFTLQVTDNTSNQNESDHTWFAMEILQ